MAQQEYLHATSQSSAKQFGRIEECPGFQNNAEILDLARFAVQEHSHKRRENLLEFVRVVKAKKQAGDGMLYYLTIETIDAGKKKVYETKVWVKPWMAFKQVEEFKPAFEQVEEFKRAEVEPPSAVPSDRGANI